MEVVSRHILVALFLVVSVAARCPASPDECTNIRTPSDVLLFSRACFNRWTKKQPANRQNLEHAFVEEMRALYINNSDSRKPNFMPMLQRFHGNLWDNRLRLLNHSNRSNWFSEVLSSEIVSLSCHNPNGSQCLRFRFHLPRYVSKGRRYLADLWLHKKEGMTEYTIVQVIQDTSTKITRRVIFNVLKQTMEEGWTRLDVSPLIKNISTNILDLEVYSNSNLPVRFRAKRPLIIAYSYVKSRRKTRARRL
ncbi:inhibin beta E chain [Nephila pilipes]|uniref:Inhibin beta E chain n=1 Tax=Nephila pilipes TaxID=299642 RepID=A0A8X6NDX1_NEPPI|nr:inhibin beta E chain [Nephila pilipes]